MATCHKYSSYYGQDMDWLYTFFHPHHEPDHRAGTEFRYDTSASYTLDVLVERITGMNFLEYLK
jgi:CubicO group peptidase (beta-lactamase class C family)